MNKREKTGLIIILGVFLTIIAFVICFVIDMKLNNIKEQKDLEKFNSEIKEFNTDIKNITKVEIYDFDNQKDIIKVIEEKEILNEIIETIENGKYFKMSNIVTIPVTASDYLQKYYFKFLVSQKVIASGSYIYGSKELIFSNFKYKIESVVLDEIVKPFIIEKKNNLLLAFELFLDKNAEYKEMIEFYEMADDYTLRIKYKEAFSQESLMELVQKIAEEIPEIKSFVSIKDEEITE